jgi:hypothetical protein
MSCSALVRTNFATNPPTHKGYIGTAELRPSVRYPYLPRSVRTWPCACSARYHMLLLDDRERPTEEGNVSHTVAAMSKSPVASAASRKGNG